MPKTPLILDGEALLDFDPDDDGDTLFHGSPEIGLLFNGEASIAVEFGQLPGFNVPVAWSSVGGTLIGEDVDVWYSGVTGLDINDIVPWLPLGMHSKRFTAGRFSSTLADSFVQFGANATLGEWEAADALLHIDMDGAELTATVNAHLATVTVTGGVDTNGFELTGTANVNVPLKVPSEVSEGISVAVNYTANAAVCSTEMITNGVICGTRMVTDGVACGTSYIESRAECGWDTVTGWFCGWSGLCSREEARSCDVDNTCSVDNACPVPASCTRDEIQQRNVYIPQINIGTLEGEISVTITEDDLDSVPDLDFCPLTGGCQPFDPTTFSIDPGELTICGDIPGHGHQCFDGCELFNVPELCDGAPSPEGTVTVPTGVPMYLNAVDAELSIRAASTAPGTAQALGNCPAHSADPNCQWIFERSPTRAGAFYVRNLGADLYMHASGGAFGGNAQTLHGCPKASDHPNCQWYVEQSPSRSDAVYLESAGAELSVHSNGGSHNGAAQTLHACPRDANHANCQWNLAFGDPVRVNEPVYISATDVDLSMHASGGSLPGAPETLHSCPRGSNHPNCQWIFERSPSRPGAYYIKSLGADLYVHANGGGNAGARQTLHSCPKGNDHPNCQWYIERSPTRPGSVYLKSAAADLYIHTNWGNTAGHPQALHGCPKGGDYAHCQWRIAHSAPVQAGEPVYLRAADADLSMHAHGGSLPGAQETLHDCPRNASHPNCQWIFEPSTTRAGAYYIKSVGADLYVHAHGGANRGAAQTLHGCPKGSDIANCQWYVESSTTRADAIYIKSAGANLYIHSAGGSVPGAHQTLHACPKGNDYGNCQWYVE